MEKSNTENQNIKQQSQNAFDLIDRQAAIDALEREKTYCTAYRDGYAPNDIFKKYNTGLTDGIKALEKLPSAQPERKRGKWIGIDDYPYETWECDQCGCIYEKIPSWTPNFCPNCGADMRGETE